MQQQHYEKVKVKAFLIYNAVKQNPGIKTHELEQVIHAQQGYLSQTATAAGKAFHYMIQKQIIIREKHKHATRGMTFYSHRIVRPLEDLNAALSDLQKATSRKEMNKKLGLSNKDFWKKKDKNHSEKKNTVLSSKKDDFDFYDIPGTPLLLQVTDKFAVVCTDKGAFVIKLPKFS